VAYFAEIDSNSVVLRVVAIDNSDTANNDGEEVESVGVTFCQSLFGGGTWKQTSYNNRIRTRFAGIGYTYDSTRDAFLRPKPYNSWVLDSSTLEWEAPSNKPSDASLTKTYSWNEDTTSWVED